MEWVKYISEENRDSAKVAAMAKDLKPKASKPDFRVSKTWLKTGDAEMMTSLPKTWGRRNLARLEAQTVMPENPGAV